MIRRVATRADLDTPLKRGVCIKTPLGLDRAHTRETVRLLRLDREKPSFNVNRLNQNFVIAYVEMLMKQSQAEAPSGTVTIQHVPQLREELPVFVAERPNVVDIGKSV